MEIRKWLVEYEDVEGVHRVLVRHHQYLISKPLFEAVGIAVAAIAHASIAGSQRGPSNLQKFRTQHPPTFTGGGDPMVVDHWFIQIEKVLEVMEITFDITRIRLAVFQLESEAQIWWRWAKTSRDLEVMTWAEFQELFMGKYFPETARHAKAQEFLELKQGATTVMDYVARFTDCPRRQRPHGAEAEHT